MDTEEQMLEAQLSTIAAEIIVAGEMQYREHLVWVYEESLRRREEMRQAEIRKKLEAEKAERERLIKLEADRLKRLIDSGRELPTRSGHQRLRLDRPSDPDRERRAGACLALAGLGPSPGRQARSHRHRADMRRLQRPRVKQGRTEKICMP